MNQSTRNALLSVLLAGSALLTATGSSQAALLTGRLDPLFGGPSALSTLFVTGTETFGLADACLSLNGFVSASGTCGSTAPAMRFTGAMLDFFQGGANGTLVGTATFIPGNPISPIVGMWFGNGQVLGVQSLVIGSADLLIGNILYSLDMQLGYTDLSSSPAGIGQFTGGNTFTSIGQLKANSTTTLFVDSRSDPCGIGQLTATCAGSSDALATTLTTTAGSVATVPEPGSLALTLVALSAGALVRRRRSRR